VFKTMRGFGEHLQYSVFRCELTETRLVSLRDRLQSIIHQGEDSVLFARLGPTGAETLAKIETLGRPRRFQVPGANIR
jgi:CRISPR-associated protein Cas2